MVVASKPPFYCCCLTYCAGNHNTILFGVTFLARNKMKPNKRLAKSAASYEKLKKDYNCRQCYVRVQNLDFKKILGKYTRVKLRFETISSSEKPTTMNTRLLSTNSRLKNKENGMVEIQRSAYKKHPVREINQKPNPVSNTNSKNKSSSDLMDYEHLKKPPIKTYTRSQNLKVRGKKYSLPSEIEPIKESKETVDKSNRLTELFANIDNSILPNIEWGMDVFPKREKTEDVVYDKIAAELESLMHNEKGKLSIQKTEDKPDDFPSILDILNDNTTATSKNTSIPSNFAKNEIEAMLSDNKPAIGESMDEDVKEPGSPSILDEKMHEKVDKSPDDLQINDTSREVEVKEPVLSKPKPQHVTQVIFRKTHNDMHCCSVKLNRTLKYTIELESKPVELLGAPKMVSSIEDIKILLQIVNECSLESNFVWDKSIKG